MRQVNPTSNSDEPEWLKIARREIGVKEVRGGGNHPRILQYHAATRLKAQSDEIPWCASYVCWCLEQAGVRSTRSARAADFATWGQPCELKDGAIVVFSKADPDAGGSGHVAFCVGVEGDSVMVLGGNQANAVSVAKRPRSRIVAVRWPLAS
jgi:uncharacterized protein (TIGR02594 family)